MGAFQAITGGIGETGEALGQGMNAALNEALKVQAQQHEEAVENARVGIAQTGQQQEFQLGQQRNELLRESLLDQGWKDMGLTVDPASGNYMRNFYNTRSGQNSRIPINGTPPDSPMAMMGYYQHLYQSLLNMKDAAGKPLFNDLQARDKALQVAFRMPQLYREGPVGMMEGFREYAQGLVDSGVTQAKSSTGKMIDLTTPNGPVEYAQDEINVVFGRGGYFRYGTGNGFVGNRDMTGFTAGERREYLSAIAPLKAQEQFYLNSMRAEMMSAYTPDQTEAIRNKYAPILAQLQSQEQAIFQGIQGRRNPNAAANPPGGAGGMVSLAPLMSMLGIKMPTGGGPTPPNPNTNIGKTWSLKAFMGANPNATPNQVALAKKQAAASGYNVVP